MSKSFKKDLTGQRFGRLTVLGFIPTEEHRSYWKCRCDCGNTIITYASALTSGSTVSCGCYRKEMVSQTRTRHGNHGTRLYRIWQGMKDRCTNPHSNDYKHYGGRGITVCDEWKKDFMSFYKWSMENCYCDDLTIDRIDVNGNYEPSNCRWVDINTQLRNTRRNIVVEYQGEKICLTEAAERSGINFSALLYRYHKGDRGEQLFRPVKK